MGYQNVTAENGPNDYTQQACKVQKSLNIDFITLEYGWNGLCQVQRPSDMSVWSRSGCLGLFVASNSNSMLLMLLMGTVTLTVEAVYLFYYLISMGPLKTHFFFRDAIHSDADYNSITMGVFTMR